jgi:diacylglycerol kinase
MTAPHPHLTFGGKAKALRYAWQGLAYMFRTQPNSWIQGAIWVVVTIVGLWFGLTGGEWCAAVLAMALVWITEALNTAIEDVVDLASPERHVLAGRAKDVGAASVLVATVAAGIVGLVIFGPRFWILLFASR